MNTGKDVIDWINKEHLEDYPIVCFGNTIVAIDPKEVRVVSKLKHAADYDRMAAYLEYLGKL